MLRCRDALIASLLIAARVASAQALAGPPLNAQAQAHFDKALAAYSTANYRAASVEFELAYGLDARRELLFAWAQAERLSGNCDRAVMLYRRFLDQAPSEAEAAKANRELDRCRASSPAPTEPASPPAPPLVEDAAVDRPSPPPPLQQPPRIVEHDSHWYSNPWVDGLVGGGGAAIVVGGVFLWLAHSSDNAADGATQYGDARQLVDQADTRRLIGTITLAGGGALVVGGIALSWWHRDHDTAVSWSPLIGPGTVGVAGAF
jgi:tetratricopeptide (TPR) repeat protein